MELEMTVEELIAALQSLSPSLAVFTRDGENGQHLIVRVIEDKTGCCDVPVVRLIGRLE